MGFTKVDYVDLLSVLDTRASTNLIDKDAVTRLRLTQPAPGPNSISLKDTGGYAPRIGSTTVMNIRIADYLARVPFLVVEHLSTDMILGCDYIGNHVDSIHYKKGVLYMSTYSSVQVFRRSASVGGLTPARDEAQKLWKNPFCHCRRIYVARKIVLPP